MIAATTPEIQVFSQANACGSAPPPLEYSHREACFPELNARLRAEGFEPPGKGLAAWVRLARIVQVDAESVTVEELVEEACDWAVRVTERIRMQVAGCGFGASSHSGERVVSGMDASAEQGVPV